jgi:branched-chain amino acid transport system permease protein
MTKPDLRSADRRRRLADLSTPVILALIIVAVALIASLMGSRVMERTVTTGLINLVMVIGLYVFVGNSGVFSFGHMAFAAIGAYTAALLVLDPVRKPLLIENIPGWLADASTGPVEATIIAGVVAAIFGFIVSIPVARLSGIGASIATFAVLVIVFVVASNLKQITNGTNGMVGVPTSTTVSSGIVWSLVALAIAFAFQLSRWGFRLRASREDEVAAQAVGIGIRRERRIALVLSAFIFGIGGALYGLFFGTFTPEAFFVNGSFMVIAMLVVGGITSLSGAVVGSVLISVLTEALRRAEEGFSLGFVDVGRTPGLREVGLALVLVAILVLRPAGLLGGRELKAPVRK